MDGQLERTFKTLFLYIKTAARLLYAQKWKPLSNTYSGIMDGEDAGIFGDG